MVDQIFVLKYKKKKHKIKVPKTGQVKDLKQAIFQITQIPIKNQKIVGLKNLKRDEQYICSLRLKKNHPISVINSTFGKESNVMTTIKKYKNQVIELVETFNNSKKSEKDIITLDEKMMRVLLQLDNLTVNAEERIERKKIIVFIQNKQKELDRKGM